MNNKTNTIRLIIMGAVLLLASLPLFIGLEKLPYHDKYESVVPIAYDAESQRVIDSFGIAHFPYGDNPKKVWAYELNSNLKCEWVDGKLKARYMSGEPPAFTVFKIDEAFMDANYDKVEDNGRIIYKSKE